MNKELGINANRELGIRKGSIVGIGFLYSDNEKGFINEGNKEKEAGEKLFGKYKDRNNEICGKCFSRKTKNGVCYCD